MASTAGEMPFLDHLEELRSRILRSLAAVVVGCGLGLWLVQRFQLVTVLKEPIAPYLTGGKLVVTSPTEPVMIVLKLGLLVGLVLSSPVILWQTWAFLAPALEPAAARALAVFAGVAAVLMAAGVLFGYLVALPASLRFLTDFDSHLYDVQVRAGDYYSFATTVLLAVGLVFELPIFILGLVRLRVISAATLRRNRRIGYVAVAALAVALPGVDPVTTLLEMGPLLALYEASIWLAAAFERRWFAAPRPAAPAS